MIHHMAEVRQCIPRRMSVMGMIVATGVGMGMSAHLVMPNEHCLQPLRHPVHGGYYGPEEKYP